MTYETRNKARHTTAMPGGLGCGNDKGVAQAVSIT
jgi:hypothetical protein